MQLKIPRPGKECYIKLIENDSVQITADYDALSIYAVDQREHFYSYVRIDAYDYLESIINGIGVNQLDGWSTSLISNNNSYNGGNANFLLSGYDQDSQTGEYTDYHHASGTIYLSSANLRWGDGYDNSPSIPEPASLALLGIGLVGMGVVRLRRG